MSNVTEKTWGSYEILSKGDGFIVKKLIIKPRMAISYQYHNHREELWYVIEGHACFILNDAVSFGKEGDVFKVPVAAQHKVINVGYTDLVCIEVWRGRSEKLSEDDITRV